LFCDIVTLKANFTHFTELLEEHEGVGASHPSIHPILKEAIILSPKKHRKNHTGCRDNGNIIQGQYYLAGVIL